MEANELRIGNLVLLPCEGHEDELVSINKYDFEEPYNFKPIPLTEEILLKSGFENKELINNNYQKGEFYYHLDTCHFYTSDDLNAYCVKVEYVHQLQNLYFALTGEELEIEL